MIRMVALVLLICNICLLVRYFVLKDNINAAEKTTENLNLTRKESDAELLEIENTYNRALEDNKWLIEEKENWQRLNQKLEDILR